MPPLLNGRASGNQPYLKLTASLNALLWRTNPFFSSGRVVSQIEEPFSLANSTCLLRLSSICRLAAHSSWCRLFFPLNLPLLCFILVSKCSGISCFISRVRLTKGVVMSQELRYCSSAISVGLINPMPPRRHGRASNLCSSPAPTVPCTKIVTRNEWFSCENLLIYGNCQMRCALVGLSDRV